jgi:hypothetical protein
VYVKGNSVGAVIVPTTFPPLFTATLAACAENETLELALTATLIGLIFGVIVSPKTRCFDPGGTFTVVQTGFWVVTMST